MSRLPRFIFFLLLTTTLLPQQPVVNTPQATGELSIAVRAADPRGSAASFSAQSLTVQVNGQPASILRTQGSEVPRLVAILLDTSGSNRNNPAINEAILRAPSLLKLLLRPGDAGVVVTFSDDAFVDAPPTADQERLAEALRVKTFHGGSAVLDAIAATANYLSQQTKQAAVVKAIVILSDGADNNSRQNDDEASRIANANQVPVYFIRTPHPKEKFDTRASRTAEAISRKTGALTSQINKPGDLDASFAKIAQHLDSTRIVTVQHSGPAGKHDLHWVSVYTTEGAKLAYSPGISLVTPYLIAYKEKKR